MRCCRRNSSPSRCRSRYSAATASASSRWSRRSAPCCPATFQCTCRTHDQAGRIVVPIFEENRVVKQMVIDDLDPLTAGRLAGRGRVRHRREAHHRGARARPAGREARRAHARRRSSRPAAAAPADAGRHRRGAEADRGVAAAIQRQFPHPRPRPGRQQLHQDLLEALRYDDEPKADPAHGGVAGVAAKPGGGQAARCSTRPGRASPSWCATVSTWRPRSADGHRPRTRGVGGARPGPGALRRTSLRGTQSNALSGMRRTSKSTAAI